MQRPFLHFARARGSIRQGSGAAIFVAALHFALIYALLNMLNIHIIPANPPPIDFSVIRQSQPKEHLLLPQPAPVAPLNLPTEPQPVFKIEEQQHDTITAMQGPPQPPKTAATGPSQFEAAQAVAGTHTIPDYPVLSRRLGEEGAVLLRIAIGEDGQIQSVSVLHSSGYARLDEAARMWVLQHWRYVPARRDGKPVSSMADASVVFNLKDRPN